MKVLIQRVSKASVTVNDEVVGQIGVGFVILVGVTHTDTQAEAEWLAQKVAGLRLFEDSEGKMNLGLADVGGSVLVVSQFTLYGDAAKGRRPSWIAAARPEQADPLITHFIRQLEAQGLTVATGVFGAHMVVDIQNNGPVTLLIERG